MKKNTQNIIPILTWKKDHDSTYLGANEVCANLFGFKKDNDIIGVTDHDIPSKICEFAEIFRDHDAKVVSTKKPLKLLEIQPCYNDNWRIFITIKSPIINNDDVATGTYGNAYDITDLFKNMPSILSQIQHYNKNVTQSAYIIDGNASLSARQQEVVYYMLRGKSAKEIAQEMKLSARTIEKYLDIIKNKFNVSLRSQLIESCVEQGYMNILPSSLLQKQLSIQLPY